MTEINEIETMQKHELVRKTLSFLTKKGYLTYLGQNVKAHTCSYAVNYCFSRGRDRRYSGGLDEAVIGQLDLAVFPGDDTVEQYNFAPPEDPDDYETLDESVAAFQAFRDDPQPAVFRAVLGDRPADTTAPDGEMHCTDTELFRWLYVWYCNRTVTLFTRYKTAVSRRNSMNSRIGDGFEKIIVLDAEFCKETGYSFTGAMTPFFRACGTVIKARRLPHTIGYDGAPVKTDLIIRTTNGTHRISAKCPQTLKSVEHTSILSTGVSYSKCGLAEVISRGHPTAGETLLKLNANKAWVGSLKSIKDSPYLTSVEYEELCAGFSDNYDAVIMLSLFGEGNPYTRQADHKADMLLAYSLQSGHGCWYNANRVRAKLARMTLEDKMMCFPLGATSRKTARLSINAKAFSSI